MPLPKQFQPEEVSALLQEHGTVAKAAKAVGVNRMTFYHYVTMYDLKPQPIPRAEWQAEGVTAAETLSWPEVYQEAVAEYRKLAEIEHRKQNQVIKLPGRYVGICGFSDQHFGWPGTNVERAFYELDVAVNAPSMYLLQLCDLFDNMFLPKMANSRFENPLSRSKEIVLVEKYLERAAPRLVALIEGNHDKWIQELVGIDFLRRLVARYAPDCLFDTDDCLFTLQVGDWAIPARAKHKWRGSSIWNETHGIERGQREDQNFILGFGGHRHIGGVAREFTVGGAKGLAVMLGSYKEIDPYAKKGGFAMHNRSTGVAVVIDSEARTFSTYDNIEAAAEFLEKVT